MLINLKSGAVIFIPNVINIGSDILKCIRADSQTYGQHGDDLISLIFFSK
jgi:hypothetical protein